MSSITVYRSNKRAKKSKLRGLGALSLLSLALIAHRSEAQSPPTDPAATNATGAVFAMTNRAANNEVVSFARAADGTLTQANRYSTGGNGIGVDFDTQHGLRLSKDHRFLYACNPGSDNVTVFSVNGTQLTRIQQVYAGDQPLSITLSEGIAYVLDGSVAGNGVTGFIVASNGSLRPLSDSFRALSSPIAVPGDVEFSPNGRSLIVTGKVGNFIDVFQVRDNGLLSMPQHNPGAPNGRRTFAATFRDDGRLFTVESGLPILDNAGVSSYNLDRATRSLSVITNSAKNQQTDGCWIVVTDNQQYAYTANFVSGSISSYRLGPNGTASLIDGADIFFGDKSEPTDLAFSTGSRYLYNLLRGTGGVAGFRVEQDGTLRNLGVFGVGQALPIADGASGLAAY